MTLRLVNKLRPGVTSCEFRALALPRRLKAPRILASSFFSSQCHRHNTNACDLAACCIWTSKLDPETPWSSCLDCQTNDYEGWPEENEELEDDIREAILEECTRVKDHVTPSGSASAGEDTTKEDANILLHQYLSLLISGTLTCYWRTYAQDDVKNAIHSTLDNDSMIWSIYSGPFET